MSSEKAVAIVLRTTDFSETSSVVMLFTREFGKMSALAKGARRLKGPFESALDLLAVCRIVFLRKSSGALDLLTEAKLERRFRPESGQLANLYAAYYIAELLNDLTDHHDPHPELFDAADQTLAALRGELEVVPLMLRFELTALRILGHLPSLDTCVECGARVVMTARVPFGVLAGGVLCGNCRSGQKQVVSVSVGVIQAMARLAAPAAEQNGALSVDRPLRGELRAVLNRYLANLLGHEPQMHRYLGTLAS